MVDLSLHESGQDLIGNFSFRAFHQEGMALAVRLKAEIGGEARVLYEALLSDPEFRPLTVFEIDAVGKAVLYVHRPHAGYVIDCDYAGAWASIFQPERAAFIGSNCAGGKFWSGQKDISAELIDHFDAWQDRFETADFSAMEPGQDRHGEFSWCTFHRDGLELAKRLKRELGSEFIVIYNKPFEDKSNVAPARFRVDVDGQVHDYLHRPFWAAEMGPV